VRLWAAGDRLDFAAPQGVMDDGRRAELAGLKPKLLRLLSAAADATPWPPRPAELARWSVPWRQRWADRAAGLEDVGVGWPGSERLAFDEVQAERIALGLVEPPPAAPEALDPTPADFARACVPPGERPPPPRPDALPTHGLTEAGRVVALPRRVAAAYKDPLERVTGPGWPAWYPATTADRRYVKNPEDD
jgi:hypothetical protein